MNKYIYTYLGSAATMYLGLGFIPRRLVITGGQGTENRFEWNEGLLRTDAISGGILTQNHADTQRTVYTQLTGLRPWPGGTILTAESANYKTPVAFNPTYNVDWKGNTTLWTTDTAANGTGHFDATAGGTYAGTGSKVILRDRVTQEVSTKWIATYTDWDDTNDVTLAPIALPGSADVMFIGYLYGLGPAPANQPLPPGLVLVDTTYLTDATVHTLEVWE